MAFVTLSFLVTMPECWVPALGSSEHGFPLLSGAGRLVTQDAIIANAVLTTDGAVKAMGSPTMGKKTSHENRPIIRRLNLRCPETFGEISWLLCAWCRSLAPRGRSKLLNGRSP